MKSDRPYNGYDLRRLRTLKAPVENDDFHAIYLEEFDVWCRGKHVNAEMPEATLHRMVVEWERSERAKGVKPAEVEVAKPATPKKQLQKA